jgi:hypothetical protein
MRPTAVHLERVALAAAWWCLPQAVARLETAELAAAWGVPLQVVAVAERQEARRAQVEQFQHPAVP